jgi:hypothetical protein
MFPPPCRLSPCCVCSYLGFANAMLGVTGFETSANFVEEQHEGVFVLTLRFVCLDHLGVKYLTLSGIERGFFFQCSNTHTLLFPLFHPSAVRMIALFDFLH